MSRRSCTRKDVLVSRRWWWCVVVVAVVVHLSPHQVCGVSDDDGSGLVIRNSSYTVHKCLGRVNDAVGKEHVIVPGAFVSDSLTTSFRLKRKELNCKKGRFKVLFQLSDRDNVPRAEESSSKVPPSVKVLKMDSKSWKTVSYSDPSVRVMKDGAYLRIANEFFHPDEFCFDQIDSDEELTAFVCFPECYGQRPCVTKCCGQDEVWDVTNRKCRKASVKPTEFQAQPPQAVSSNNNSLPAAPPVKPPHSHHPHDEGKVWTPWLFRRSMDNNCVKKVSTFHRNQLSVHIREQLPSCHLDELVLIPLRKIHNQAIQRFRVLWSGTVIMRDKYGNWSEFSDGRYCVDGMVNFREREHGSGHVGALLNYTGDFADQLVLACPDQVPAGIEKKPIPLRYAVLLISSACILFLTALISCLLWDRQNVYEWTVSCEVISMFFMILFVGIAHTVARRPEKSDFGSAHCVFIGAASHAFWLSTFCWLVVVNFEIWWNFRSIVNLRQTRRWFRFAMYALVGWGIPLLIVVAGLILDRTWGLQNQDLDCADLIVPNYGQLNCYISKQAQGPYLFYPIGVILGFNLVFYLLTVCKMWGYRKKSQAIIQYRSRGQTQPILIFAKLFIVMGVSWIFEIVSWAVTQSEVDKIPLYWVIFDIVTLFQSISIFVIFVWKKEVLTRLWYKYPSWKVVLTPLTKLPGCGIIPNDRDRLASLHTSPIHKANQSMVMVTTVALGSRQSVDHNQSTSSNNLQQNGDPVGSSSI